MSKILNLRYETSSKNNNREQQQQQQQRHNNKRRSNQNNNNQGTNFGTEEHLCNSLTAQMEWVILYYMALVYPIVVTDGTCCCFCCSPLLLLCASLRWVQHAYCCCCRCRKVSRSANYSSITLTPRGLIWINFKCRLDVCILCTVNKNCSNFLQQYSKLVVI